jgi:hypothetical protein
MCVRRYQRVLNDLQMTRFSCGRMIRLLAHPLPPFPPASLSQSFRVSPAEYTDGRGRGRVDQLTTARKPGPLQII